MEHEKKWIQKYKVVNSSGVCKNSWYIKRNKILQETLITKITLFILLSVSKDSSATLPALIATIRTYLDLTTELLLSSTRRNSK